MKGGDMLKKVTNMKMKKALSIATTPSRNPYTSFAPFNHDGKYGHW
jgi:hypothetical protein